MHAFIIYGADQEKRETYIREKLRGWNISAFDEVEIGKDSSAIGIDDVRNFQKRLLLFPRSSRYTVGIIHSAHLLTEEAQHALLKTLEEPPPHAKIFCETPYTALLLPTIVSRCHVVHTMRAPDEESRSSPELIECIHSLPQMSTSQRLLKAESVGTARKDAGVFLDQLISAYRSILLDTLKEPVYTNEQRIVADIRRVLLGQKHLAANVSPRLVLDTILLDLT